MYGFVITTAGEAMLARAAAGETLVLDGASVGKGVVLSTAAAKALTALIDPVAEATTSSPAVAGQQISITVEYRNDMNGGLETGFALSEFGITAHVGDDPSGLLYYGSLGDAPQTVKPIDQGLDAHRFPVAIAVTGEVTVTLDYPVGVFLTQAELEAQKGQPGGLAELGDNGAMSVAQGGTGATTAQGALYNLGAGVRPSLLDNAYFVGGGTGWGVFPVNQKGALSGNTDRVFICDRWNQFGSEWRLTPDGLVMAKRADADYWALFQVIQTSLLRALAGEKLTASVLFGDSFVTSTQILTDSVTYFPFENGERIEVYAENGGVQYYGGNVTRTFKSVKLEVGDNQTHAYQKSDGSWAMLPQNLNFGQTLAKCQAYQFVSKDPNASFPAVMNGKAGTVTLLTPTPIAKTPVFVKDATSGYGVVRTSTGAFAVTGALVRSCIGNFVEIDITTEAQIVSNCVWRECTFSLETGM